MTSLGKLIFIDIHSRNPKISFSNDLQANHVESLSFAFQNLFHMPFDIIENYGNTIHTLDISNNKFCRNLHFLSEFENLTSLNLDYNNIDDFTVFPYMPKLQLLWINHNKIDQLYPFIKNLYESMPNLKYLSLMGNKAAPSYLNGGTFYDYLQYRLFIISWFPHLVHLDDRTITFEQCQEAKRLFKRPFLESLSENAPLPECLKYLHKKLANMFFKPILPNKQQSRGTNFVI
ncbi:leucine-rich melanocyte differentiation-associated protein-like [Polistes fuscatus]|uniref:leucine-rich repeat-containing protein C10orf11-like n=1 Tax=Polistes canadensis TaxID=91411 RepID=UPI000718B927|nr:PREDICTED: leucine-rich repeat-containing protein C10orf11-like [Polistes canadensis]XP_043490800.1 leucine-rich melanocyte differentiation-associated protein-like [Polistes fuscatus]